MNFIKKLLLKRRLSKVDSKTVKKHTLKGFKTYAKVCKVYDGDTITIIIEKDKKMFKYSCRLLGIDTPELRTKNKREKEKGLKARDYLRRLILNKIVKVTFDDFDKYGRPLITVFYKNKNVAQRMLKETFCVVYDGGKKMEKW